MTRKEEEMLLQELEKLRDDMCDNLMKLCNTMTALRESMERKPVYLQLQGEAQ